MLQKLILHLHFTKSLKYDSIYNVFMDPRRRYLPNINTLRIRYRTCASKYKVLPR